MEQAKKAFGKRELGFILGIVVALVVYLIPIPVADLSHGGHIMLALTLMTVVWWAMQITQPAYTSGVFLALMVIFGVIPGVPATETTKAIPAAAATAALVFKSWTGTTMWLIVGAYLIATAVKTSGLGERIAYNYMLKFVKDYKSIVIGIFVLTFVLSLLIPHPWPRAFLIMSVMAVIIKASGIPKEDAIKIGFTVFAASVPVSLIFLTGDAVINPLAVQAAGADMGFMEWFVAMGVPALVASIITMILILFRPTKEVSVNKDEIKAKLAEMGKMTSLEKRTAIWVIIAIVLWMTDKLHGVNIGWVTLMIAVLMAMPIIGNILTPKDWASVPVQTLVFLTAAIAIGTVGGATGMNGWIAATLLPSTAPSSLFLLAGLITVIGIALHMVLGSVIAVMGVAVPAIIAFTSGADINPIAPTLIVYMAIAAHYILPFQHLNILVGAAEDTGGYTQKETIKLGVPLIAVMFVTTMLVMVPWFSVIGLWK